MYRDLDIDALLRYAELHTQPGGKRGGHRPDRESDRRAMSRQLRPANEAKRWLAGVREIIGLSRGRRRDGRPHPPPH